MTGKVENGKIVESGNRMEKNKRTAGEAGWHVSRYNVSAKIPGEKAAAIVNLIKGTCAKYNPMELYLLSVLEELDEDHPIIERFARRGIIGSIRCSWARFHIPGQSHLFPD